MASARVYDGLMRALLVLVGLAACEPSRYGAYLTLQGDIEFDRVELYFGHALESAGTAQNFATPRLGPSRGLGFGRKFSSFDQYAVDPTKDTTLYVPPDGQNEVLGAYVVAVVSRGDQPVGIGEYFDFKVPSREVHEYLIDLVPYEGAKVERWGADPGCIAWARERGSLDKAVVGVVRADDRDCDDDDINTDCNDLCTSGSVLCDTQQTLCFTPCAIGCATSGVCAPRTCLPANACSTLCNNATLDGRFKCAIDNSPVHVEIFVDTDPASQRMCGRTWLFPLPPSQNGPPPQCLDPKIEFVDVAETAFLYTIAAEPQTPLCRLSAEQFALFTETHHLIISFAQADPTKPRQSVVVGVQSSAPGQGYCDDTTAAYRYENIGPIFDCN